MTNTMPSCFMGHATPPCVALLDPPEAPPPSAEHPLTRKWQPLMTKTARLGAFTVPILLVRTTALILALLVGVVLAESPLGSYASETVAPTSTATR